MIPITPASEALLNALVPAEGSVSTDHTDAIYDLLQPIHDVLAATDAHWQAVDVLRLAADRVEENPQVYGWFERIKQTVDAARRINADAKRSVEAISDVCFQLDTYAREMREQLARTVSPPKDRVRNLSVAEYDALIASRDEANARLGEALTEVETLKAAKGK